MTTTHTQAQRAPTASRTSLQTLLAQSQAVVQRIQDLDVPPVVDDEDQQIEGDIYSALVRDNDVETYTHDKVVDMFQGLQPWIADASTKGPAVKSSWMDHLLCYLIWKT